MIRFLLLTCCLLPGLVVPSLSCQAQDAKQQQSDDAKALNLLYGDFDAPDLTAPTLLGLTANQVSKPANIKAFATSLAGAAASFPNVGTGLGVEIAPVQFFRRSAWNGQAALNSSLQEYGQTFNRFSRGLTLSVAQVSTNVDARVAVGGALVLLDRTDPLLDAAYIDAIATRLREQEARTRLLQALDYGSVVSQQRMQEFNNRTEIYPNILNSYSGKPADKVKARERLNSLNDLLGNIGMLPSITPGHPLQTLEEFTKAQDDLVAALPAKVTASALFTDTQKKDIIAEAARLRTKVLAVYPFFFDLVQQVYTATNVVIKDAKEHFEKKLWNATIIQAGGGAVWASADKKYAAITPQAGSYFVRAAGRIYFLPSDKEDRRKFDPEALTGFKHFMYWHTQLIANVRLNTYNVPGSNTVSGKIPTDSLNSRWWYGARLVVGGAYLRLSGEFSVQQLIYRSAAATAIELAKRQPAGTLYSSTIGAEIRLVDKIWLEFAIGSTKPAGQAAQLLTLGSLKYALRNSQRFKTN